MSRHSPDGARRLVSELRRRRTFRAAGLYVVGAWLVMQIADVLFPGWGLPDAAINVLLIALVSGFPLALVFGWFYDITPGGLVRTPPRSAADDATPLSLRPADYAILTGLVLVAGLIGYDTITDIRSTPETTARDGGPTLEPLPTVPNSIAVLPFLNISSDPSNEAFCDGISEEILHKLGRFAELHVIGRTSSFAFKGSSVQIPQIAAALGVEFLLQGSVRKAGDQLRISAQLVDGTGAQRWSDSFDRKLENVFAIQSEIADLVATTVVPRVQPAARTAPSPDVAAYEAFLVGREHLYKRELPDARLALQTAIDLDPEFAEAYAELAIVQSIGFGVTGERADEVHGLIDRALALRPGLPRALAARGLVLNQQPEPDNETAVRLLYEALDAEPSMADALNWLANPLRELGREAEARGTLERALAVDPLHPVVVLNYATRLMQKGETDRAEQMLLRLTNLPSASNMPFIGLRALYTETGQLVKLNANAKRRALTDPGHYFDLQASYALLGDWEATDFWIRRSNEDYPDHWFAGYNRANLPRWQDDYAGAARIFEAVMAEKGGEEVLTAPFMLMYYGHVLALAGRHEEADRWLRPLVLDQMARSPIDPDTIDTWHALAWANRSLGREDQAKELLEWLATFAGNPDNGMGAGNSQGLFLQAQQALLTDDPDGALVLLEQAVDAGWREYYGHRRDPRWAVLADDSRYQALMSRVREDIDRQAAEIAQIDAEEDFVALLDEVVARRRQSDGLSD